MAKTKKEPVEEALEKKLWKAADKLRKNMDAAEYKHVALGLIFLKYISDAFEELHGMLLEGNSDYVGAKTTNYRLLKDCQTFFLLLLIKDCMKFLNRVI